MQTPIVSCGARKMQPSTPCSASGECGGRRSTEEMARASDGDFLRRPCRKSSEAAPVLWFTGSGIEGYILCAMTNYVETKIREIDDEDFQAMVSELCQGLGWPPAHFDRLSTLFMT